MRTDTTQRRAPAARNGGRPNIRGGGPAPRAPALLTLGAFALAGPAHAPAAVASGWQLDVAHSEVGFGVRHLGISNVKGKFKDYSATIQGEAATGKLSAVQGTIQIASIDTGIAQRDEHLRAADFFDVAKFPQATIKTKKITFTGNTVTVVADLTIKGITKEVTFAGEYLGSQRANMGYGDQLRAGYTFTATIDRKAFGLTWGAMVEAVPVVSDQVKLNLEIQILRPCTNAACA